MSGVIRIIGGKWRGRKLPVVDKEGLRPTTDRVKETLFNWLMMITPDATCLDCFSGSGSLGFEAASRGAKQVVLLEKDKQAAQQLRSNQQQLKTDMISIYQADTLSWLNKEATTQFDVVFIDPPFYQSLIGKTVTQLEQHHWLADSAYIYIESELNQPILPLLPPNWRPFRDKITGQVHSYLFIRETQ